MITSCTALIKSKPRTEFDDERTLYVAVVHTVGAIRLVTAASSRAGLAERLAGYARRHAGNQLWAGDARRLRRLCAAKQFDRAVELYFASVGERWDEEWLVIEQFGRESLDD